MFARFEEGSIHLENSPIHMYLCRQFFLIFEGKRGISLVENFRRQTLEITFPSN